jgi:hypothetical protein
MRSNRRIGVVRFIWLGPELEQRMAAFLILLLADVLLVVSACQTSRSLGILTLPSLSRQRRPATIACAPVGAGGSP